MPPPDDWDMSRGDQALGIALGCLVVLVVFALCLFLGFQVIEAIRLNGPAE